MAYRVVFIYDTLIYVLSVVEIHQQLCHVREGEKDVRIVETRKILFGEGWLF